MIHEAITILLAFPECKVFPGKVPQGEKLPFINHFQISSDHGPSKDGNQVRDIRYQISVFARQKIDALTIADNVIGILDEFSGFVQGCNIELIRLIDESDLFEEDADVHHRVLDFQIRYK